MADDSAKEGSADGVLDEAGEKLKDAATVVDEKASDAADFVKQTASDAAEKITETFGMHFSINSLFSDN